MITTVYQHIIYYHEHYYYRSSRHHFDDSVQIHMVKNRQINLLKQNPDLNELSVFIVSPGSTKTLFRTQFIEESPDKKKHIQ